jgi:hypothetical protein
MTKAKYKTESKLNYKAKLKVNKRKDHKQVSQRSKSLQA